MENRLMTADEMSKYMADLLEKHGINEYLRTHSQEENQAVIDELQDFLGGRFPPRQKDKQ